MVTSLAFVLLTLAIASAVDEFFIGSNSAKGSLNKLNENSAIMQYLERREPFLHATAIENVLPATLNLESSKGTLDDFFEALDQCWIDHEESMAIIMAHQPELAMELGGKLKQIEAFSNRQYRAFETRRRRLVFEEFQRQKKRIVTIISAGLGGLNFIAIINIMDVSFDRLTPEALVLIPIGLAFSTSAMIAVHMGLCDLVASTRDYDVQVDKPLTQNMFPCGFKDIALGASVLLIVTDSLFSSIGLLQALPPSYQEEVFWKLSILCVSAFASLTNVLLAWGVSLDRIRYDYILAQTAASQLADIAALVEYIKIVRASSKRIILLERRIKATKREIRRLDREARLCYKAWVKRVRRVQLQDFFFEVLGHLQGRRVIRGQSRYLDELHRGNGNSYLPPMERELPPAEDSEKDDWNHDDIA